MSDTKIEIEDIYRIASNNLSISKQPSISSILPPSEHTKVNALDETQTHCPLCTKAISVDPKKTIALKKLKPRFVRQIKNKFPHAALRNLDTKVCFKDLHEILQHRIDNLLEQDQSSFSKMQEDSMKNLENYEKQEEHWHDAFEQKKTFGERAADAMSDKVGSWYFVIGNSAFIIIWITLGRDPFDPFPFILLNLFLSIIAATQGPIIMMSQNRQAKVDAIQNEYVNRIILRGEHQTRHVNAKIDHIITSQWRRLLEIQEVQVDLLHILQSQQMKGDSHHSPSPLYEFMDVPESKVASKLFKTSRSLNLEVQPDDHADNLLRVYFGTPDAETNFLFTRWTERGDNFYGNIQDVKLEIEAPRPGKHQSRGWVDVGGVDVSPKVLKRISFDIVFPEGSSITMDDIFAGDGLVKIRNDFDLPHMEMSDTISVFQNGDLPTRYKPSFSQNFSRQERISDFWKKALLKVVITYKPPHQACVISLGPGKRATRLIADFYRPSDNKFDSVSALGEGTSSRFETALMMSRDVSFAAEPLKILSSVASQSFSGWEKVATAVFEERAKSVDGDVISVELSGMDLSGPGTFVFWCGDCKVVVRGVVEE